MIVQRLFKLEIKKTRKYAYVINSNCIILCIGLLKLCFSHFISNQNFTQVTTDCYGIAGSTRLDMFGLVFDRC